MVDFNIKLDKMKEKIIIFAFGALIVLSYKPRKAKEEIIEIKPVYYKLTKADVG